MLSLGFDIGSSFVKGAVFDTATGAIVCAAFEPKEELVIFAPRAGWAEQDPDDWWNCMVNVARKLFARGKVNGRDVGAIGISYQMHGLVITDAAGKPLRPSIIWCDSRAVEIGSKAFRNLGEKYCLSTMLNSPGNFTASKLRWVRENEPDLFRRIAHVLLPGDYAALRLTGEATTTVTGLSECILWDFHREKIAQRLLDRYGIEARTLGRVVPMLGVQGRVTTAAADALGVRPGTPLAYRAGDQANNAFSVGALGPGDVAATAGTSGVVYAVTDRTTYDARSRINVFAHVNHTSDQPRHGVLLCVNGSGILYAWLRRALARGATYAKLNELAETIPIGSEGLTILPFGNGAERMLENADPGARIVGLDLIRHSPDHLLRAAHEGIAFAFCHGMEIMRSMGISLRRIRAGRANLFLSPVFRQTLANAMGTTIEMFETDGAAGAARGAALGAGAYGDVAEAFSSLRTSGTVEPRPEQRASTREAFDRWERELSRALIADRRPSRAKAGKRIDPRRPQRSG